MLILEFGENKPPINLENEIPNLVTERVICLIVF